MKFRFKIGWQDYLPGEVLESPPFPASLRTYLQMTGFAEEVDDGAKLGALMGCDELETASVEAPEKPVKRKRGRPRKVRI